MHRTTPRVLCALGLILACASGSSAAIVRFTATIDGDQEGNNSASTGSAVLLYDVESNRFDLSVTLNDFPNPLTNSHIHEGAPGVAGGVVTPLGDESNYTRDGDTLIGEFHGVEHGGSVATLLQGGAYLNFHTADFPAGEIRGQLIPDPVKLYAIIDGAHEVPVRDTDAYGAAQMLYRPDTNKIDLFVFVYNFTNTLTNSHFHEAPVGVSGPVVHGLGAADVYENSGTSYYQLFSDMTYTGDPVKLLSGGAYLNFHSNVFGSGEIRGQVLGSNVTEHGRLVNVSTRGQAGTGDDSLIAGLVVGGTEPVRVLVTARGPVLSSFGVAGVLADPTLTLHDANGVLLTNDNVADAPFASLIEDSGFSPTESAESGLLLILPPGAYTGVVSGAGGSTGVALAEAFEVAW